MTGELRKVLEAIRMLILEAAPGTREGIAHGMLDYPGVASLAAQKHYVSLYVRPSVLGLHAAAFEAISCGKSCLSVRPKSY